MAVTAINAPQRFIRRFSFVQTVAFTAGQRLFALATTFLFLFDLTRFSYRTTGANQLCWPHWQNCRSLPLPAGLPESYGNGIMFAAVFGVILVALWGLFKNRAAWVIPSLWLLVAYKFFYHFVWQWTGLFNFELFHLIPTTAFLLNSPNRIFGAQAAWATCCFLAAFVKLHDSWIVGTYFSTLEIGIPLFPRSWIPFLSQAVIPFEIFCSWGLLSHRWRKYSFYLWTAFHLYSVMFVGFHYPTRCILILWSLFLPETEDGDVRPSVLAKRLNASALALIILIIMMQTLPLVYREDVKRTLRFEGYAFSMFDANFQCFETITAKLPDGSVLSMNRGSRMARGRCGPRLGLMRIHKFCQELKPTAIQWTLDQSINGDPFYQIVQTEDACRLSYSLFGKNEWMTLQNPPVVGFPRVNALDYTEQTTRREEVIFAEPTIRLSAAQNFLRAHLRIFTIFYLMVWLGMLSYVALQYLRFVKSESQIGFDVHTTREIDGPARGHESRG